MNYVFTEKKTSIKLNREKGLPGCRVQSQQATGHP